MKVEIKRESLLIIPESEQDRAFIEDTLGLSKTESKLEIERINDVSLGFQSDDKFVLKIKKNE